MAAEIKPQSNLAREERLAAKLRENLKRRKAQARAIDSASAGASAGASADVEAPPLPKPPLSR